MITQYKNISQVLTLKDAQKKDGRNLLPEDCSIIENASIFFDESEILYVGKENPKDIKADIIVNCTGKTITPEIIDSHTHLVFGGNRSEEYVSKINGVSYEEIAKKGGGILATTIPTNEASADELFFDALKKIERINSYGVGTIEIKSGYSLTYEGEKKITLVIDRLKKHFHPRIQIINTYMAAHAIPKNSNATKYIDEVVIPLMNELKSTIDIVDIFHEQGYFTKKDVIKVFESAKNLNLKIKSHADEFNDNEGASLAVKYNALSADHLMKTSDIGIKDLAKSQTVATLLPGTSFFLGKEPANAKTFLDGGVKVSIASDYNPGSCHWDNVLKVASIAAPSLKFNLTQTWAAITLNAASSLGLNDQGAIIKGMKPRFSVFNTKSLANITYNWNENFHFRIIT